MWHWFTDTEIWAAFLTLTALEIVLGIDNIIFISILVNRLPKHLQAKGRFFGIMLAHGNPHPALAVPDLGDAPDP